MKLCIVGTGYVGLVTGVVFADAGHEIACVDVDADKIKRLGEGDAVIYEIGLSDLLRRSLKAKRLRFTTDLGEALRDARIAFCCVGTPISARDGRMDTTVVHLVAKQFAVAAPDGCVFVVKSTVPPGTCRAVQALFDDRFEVVSNPVFLREGTAVQDAMRPDRVVLGFGDGYEAIEASTLLYDLYDPFVRGGSPVLTMGWESAELVKLAANSYLATRVSFVNELAGICERIEGADVDDVRRGVGADKRIGLQFFYPGVGYGGSCLSGRETALVASGPAAVRLSRLDWLFRQHAADGPPTPGVQVVAPQALKVATWDPESRKSKWCRVNAITRRRYVGDICTVRTKMGRSIACTPDHPFVAKTGDSVTGAVAGTLTPDHWLPLMYASPPELSREGASTFRLTSRLAETGVLPDQVIVWPRREELAKYTRRQIEDAVTRTFPDARRERKYDILEAGALRLSEALALGVSLDGAAAGTARSGNKVPIDIEASDEFWYVVGAYVAEGWCTSEPRSDGACRMRLGWSYAPRGEEALAERVAAYWRGIGVKASVYQKTTSLVVSVASRLLASWWLRVLRAGKDSYDVRVPDALWTATPVQQRAFLSGYWHGDGSWSYTANRRGVVLECGTVSRELADGLMRLLGMHGVVSGLRVGRCAKSTVDTYWIEASGADQIDRLMHLVKPWDRDTVRAAVARQTKRIAPTGHRPEGDVSWVRVRSVQRKSFRGYVYSLEVEGAETFATTGGLVVHNCFPKDLREYRAVAEAAGAQHLIADATDRTNYAARNRFVARVLDQLSDRVKDSIIAVWGLTFKAGTDDVRESQAVAIARDLQGAGAYVVTHDPAAVVVEGLPRVEDPYAAVTGADALCVLTEWPEYRRPDWKRLRDAMREPVIFDGRNLYDPAVVEIAGFKYYGMGRRR